MSGSRAPQRKVIAAGAGALVGGLTADLIVGVLDDHVYVAGDVPGYLAAFIAGTVPLAIGFLAGYFQPSERTGEHRRTTTDT